MSLHFSLFKPPATPITSSFLNGGSSSFLSLPTTKQLPSSTTLFPVKALKVMQGRVVCAASDKTVAVEVTRMAPHPKYKRRVRKKKKYQAHDPENRFQVGDWVQLQKCRPISKTKNFMAVAPAPRNTPAADPVSADLGLPLQSDQTD